MYMNKYVNWCSDLMFSLRFLQNIGLFSFVVDKKFWDININFTLKNISSCRILSLKFVNFLQWFG